MLIVLHLIYRMINVANNQIKRVNRWTVYGLLIVFCTPLLAAHVLYHYRELFSFKHICTGILFNPPIDSKTLPFYDEQYLGKWQLIDVRPAECDDACQRLRDTTEAIYTSLGKERDRVTSRQLSISPESKHIFEPLHAQAGGVMIIDPQGWLVVHYTPDVEPKSILKNFKRLLRLSHAK